MEVITGGRQTGKTTEAIRLANENDAYLVVHNKARARQVYHNDDYPDLDRFPITYTELRYGRGMGERVRVVIDDLDMWLHSVVDVPVEGVTMTANEATDLG